jgi:hypothetical protein
VGPNTTAKWLRSVWLELGANISEDSFKPWVDDGMIEAIQEGGFSYVEGQNVIITAEERYHRIATTPFKMFFQGTKKTLNRMEVGCSFVDFNGSSVLYVVQVECAPNGGTSFSVTPVGTTLRNTLNFATLTRETTNYAGGLETTIELLAASPESIYVAVKKTAFYS